MKFRWSLIALCLSVAGIAAAQAEDSAQRGKIAGYTCHGCHGIENYKNVYPTYSVPKVGGQSAAYMIIALKAYASGERTHPTMHAHAASMNEQDRTDIAAFFAASKVRAAGPPVGTPPAAVATCASCHGTDGVSDNPEYPNLAGQHRDYLEHALRDYKSGKRKNGVMAGIISGVKEEEIPALAKFYASQKPALCATDKIREKGKCQ
ncbi:MAG TPA: c-type cytochrome [Steroidobacteraceae bacterium]|nr:c-type cytochrome [Steroidobacteraceae bacterium]